MHASLTFQMPTCLGKTLCRNTALGRGSQCTAADNSRLRTNDWHKRHGGDLQEEHREQRHTEHLLRGRVQHAAIAVPRILPPAASASSAGRRAAFAARRRRLPALPLHRQLRDLLVPCVHDKQARDNSHRAKTRWRVPQGITVVVMLGFAFMLALVPRARAGTLAWVRTTRS